METTSLAWHFEAALITYGVGSRLFVRVECFIVSFMPLDLQLDCVFTLVLTLVLRLDGKAE